jgi:hypothetical protein
MGSLQFRPINYRKGSLVRAIYAAGGICCVDGQSNDAARSLFWALFLGLLLLAFARCPV